MSGPAFIHSTDNPLDMLGNAASVCRFLADVSGAMSGDHGQVGLTDESANGLCLILLAVEGTITEAMARM